MNNKTRILTTIFMAAALACAAYCASGTLSSKAAYAAPAAAPAANPAPVAKPAVAPVVVPDEPGEPHTGLPWMIAGFIIALAVVVIGYKKSKGEDGFDRQKFLAFILAAVAVVTVTIYGVQYLTKEPPKTPKYTILMQGPKGASGQAGLQPGGVKPGSVPVVVPAEQETGHKGFPWLLLGIAIALGVSMFGYYKSRGDDGFDRTKFLAFVFAGIAVIVVFFYGGKYLSAEPKKAPKITIAMAPPRPRPATPPSMPGPVAPAPGAPAPYVPVIKVMEKGKEVQYGSPEDFLARTTLSASEAGAFAERHLAEAKKAGEASGKKGDKAAMERAQADLKAAEELVSLVRKNAFVSPGTKIMPYVSLGKRDPFMSPLEVPKVYPTVPPNAPPLERVPTESVVVKAVVWSAKGFRALLITPDGRGYTVKLGDRVGNKGGRIVKITEKRVYVTEKIRDVLGDIETRDIVLRLYKEAE